MTVTLSLTPEIEESLLAQAERQGISLEDLLRQVVAREAATLQPRNLPAAEKARAFIQWANSHRHTQPLSDDAIERSGMYPDRW